MRSNSFAVWLGVFVAASALAAGGAPFEEASDAPVEGAVWDLSKPFWLFFAQERLLAPETPLGEAIPRAAFAHIRPAGEDARLFFILAGIAYLGLYHFERGALELESSIFSMLVPVGTTIYRDGREVKAEAFEESWVDASFRIQRTWSSPKVRARLLGEYQLAWKNYVAAESTDPAFILPADTLVHELDIVAALDTRSRGPTGDFSRGMELELGVALEWRANWNAWGMPGALYDDKDASHARTAFASVEFHKTLGAPGSPVLHGKLRCAKGWDLDRLTFIRLGGGGFGRQFDRVGAGSTGAANDGELFRSDGVPGYFGGEFLSDEYLQVNLELDIPVGILACGHISAAGAVFRDALDNFATKELLGFGLGFTRIFEWKSAFRLDLGYSVRPDGAFSAWGSSDVTFTYIRKF